MNKSYKPLLVIILLIIFLPKNIFPIKYILKDKNNKEIILQSIIDAGVSAKAVADGYGITDYYTIFFKPAFYYQNFGIGLEFDFRFRFVNNQLSFISRNWVSEHSYNRAINTLFIYLDKIEFIEYASANDPFYLKTGRIPITTFGSGLLLKDYHNYAFEPVEKEQGFYFKFNGKELDKLKLLKFPIEATLFIADLLDPDIFAIDCNINLFELTSFKDIYFLKIGTSLITDINATESNRVSGLKKDISSISTETIEKENKLTSHRNLGTETENYLTSFPLFWSTYALFKYQLKFIEVNVSNENSLLFDFNKSMTFGGGFKISSETKIINLKNSGFLLGIIAGFILQSPHFFIDYFSSNYEIMRVKQYTMLNEQDRFIPFIEAGFSIYGLKERIKFTTVLKIPIQEVFASRFTMNFVLDKTVVKGLSLGIYYETGVNAMYTMGTDMTGFLDSITRDFRFYAEASLKFYSARFKLQLGIQRPQWCIPEVSNLLPGQINAFEYLAKGGTIKYDELNRTGYFYNEKTTSYEERYLYSWGMDLNKYKNELQKFVRLEIAFVF